MMSLPEPPLRVLAPVEPVSVTAEFAALASTFSMSLTTATSPVPLVWSDPAATDRSTVKPVTPASCACLTTSVSSPVPPSIVSPALLPYVIVSSPDPPISEVVLEPPVSVTAEVAALASTFSMSLTTATSPVPLVWSDPAATDRSTVKPVTPASCACLTTSVSSPVPPSIVSPALLPYVIVSSPDPPISEVVLEPPVSVTAEVAALASTFSKFLTTATSPVPLVWSDPAATDRSTVKPVTPASCACLTTSVSPNVSVVVPPSSVPAL